MTPKERAVMQQALEALERASAIMDSSAQQRQDDAITALRDALGEQAEQEPVHWVVPDFGFLFPSEDAAQRYLINIESDARPTPCYAAPVRTKDLTDDEIANAMELLLDDITCVELEDARAVIAADREKNRG